MYRRLLPTGLIVFVMGLGASASAQYGPNGYASASSQGPAAAYAPRSSAAALNPAATSMLNYYGSRSAMQAQTQLPQRPRFVPQGGRPVGVGAAAKPHAAAAADPTISPYLNLFRTEQEDSLPNYYAFVRPHKQQIETNRTQQRQLQSLERQVQRTAYQQPTATGGLPPTGTRARFGDTGQYYSGWQR